MKFTSPMRQLAALALTAVFLTTAALSGFAVYAMPIQAAYPQESIYLFDADTGETLVEQNPDLPRCVASLTKMMTALLVLESGTDLNASITIPDSLTPELQSIRANRGHTIGLQAGETVRRIDMMYAMLLPSANDAASVLANDTSGSLAAFAAQMNVRASQLGCTATHFTCPHGLYDGGTTPQPGTWPRSRWPATQTPPTAGSRIRRPIGCPPRSCIRPGRLRRPTSSCSPPAATTAAMPTA